MRNQRRNRLTLWLAVLGCLLFVWHLSPTEASAGEAEDLLNLAEKIQASNPAFKIELKTLEGKASYKVGDEVSFAFKTDKDCYLYLIDVGTSGAVTVIFPNKWQESNRVQGGKEYRVPQIDSKFIYRLKGPVNNQVELVKALATAQPIQSVEQAALESKGPFKQFKRPRMALKDIAAELNEKQGAVADVTFQVQE